MSKVIDFHNGSRIRGVKLWEKRYHRRLVVTDFLVVVGTVFGAQVSRFGIASSELNIAPFKARQFAFEYSLLSALLVFIWILSLSVSDSRSPKIYGMGSSEYKRVFNATFFTFGGFAIGSYLLKADIGRGYLMIALPLGLTLLLVSRWLWRKRLHRQRDRGQNQYRTLIIGESEKCRHVVNEVNKAKRSGLQFVGAASSHSKPNILPDLPVVTGIPGVIEAIDSLEIDTVVMTSSDEISPAQMRQLGWELESRDIDLIVAASLTDIAGPRIHTKPLAGLPLIQVDYPKFVGRKRFTKRMFDIISSTALLLLLAPVYMAVAIAVKVNSRGPIFYSQERIGLNGLPFKMFKFRSMVQDADDQLKSLLDKQGTSDKPLHKVTNDPRITPVGRFIRKYSLDELPQILNVFLGTMTLVGPRPQRDSEVALYGTHDHRRLMVKPGVTGLWQVSGRSNLDWDDAIRLDLYYVENWSIAGDLVILLRTVKTVIRPEGAH